MVTICKRVMLDYERLSLLASGDIDGVSEVRHCAIRRPDDTAVRQRLRALVAERRRLDYRRLHILLGREGIMLNHERLFRLYRQEKLGVRRRGSRKRALVTRSPMVLPEAPNRRWSLDFVSDAFNSGSRFRVLAVVDDFTRECLALVVDTSLSGLRVGRELDRIIEIRDSPATIVSDNSTELTSHVILRWQEERGQVTSAGASPYEDHSLGPTEVPYLRRLHCLMSLRRSLKMRPGR